MVVASTVIEVGAEFVGPASRAVRRVLRNGQDTAAMRTMLEEALGQAADSRSAPGRAGLGQEKLAAVANGAVNVGMTGHAEQVSFVVAFWQRRPAAIGGYRRHQLQAVGSLAAMAELARWIQVSAAANQAQDVVDGRFADLAARIFMRAVCYPKPYSANYEFCGRLADAWLTQDEKARARDRTFRRLEYPTVLTGAVAAVGAIIGWTGIEVLRVAGSVGTVTVAVAIGVGLFARRSNSGVTVNSRAEYVDLRALLEQISAFLVDVSDTKVDSAEGPAAADDEETRKRLSQLLGNLQQRLLPEAQARASLLASHLRRVSDQLRLFQERRLSFDSLSLQAAMLDLRKALEDVAEKRQILVPAGAASTDSEAATGDMPQVGGLAEQPEAL
jgi:hypothetical protein